MKQTTENPTNLDELTEFCNDHGLGWKSRCEELTIFAETLEYKIKESSQLINQMLTALKACEEKVCHGVWSDGDNPTAMNLLIDAIDAAERVKR